MDLKAQINHQELNKIQDGFNTRTIDPKKLDELRKEVVKKQSINDIYSIFLNQTHLRQSLINPIPNNETIKNK